MFCDACRNGDLDTVKNELKTNLSQHDIDWGFQIACEKKHEDICLVIVDYYCDENLLRSACSYNLEKVVQKILAKDSDIYVHNYKEEAFRAVCRNGNTALAKMLYEYSKATIDIHVLVEEPFRVACKGCYLETAKWLYELSERMIDVSALQNDALKTACIQGDEDVVLWLYSLGCVPDSWVFQISCLLERENISRWIYSIGGDESCLSGTARESFRKWVIPDIIRYFSEAPYLNEFDPFLFPMIASYVV